MGLFRIGYVRTAVSTQKAAGTLRQEEEIEELVLRSHYTATQGAAARSL